MLSRLNRRNYERGSALLIVFLFAAVLAVSLYMEMPSYAFEAKRNKEQLLIDRGNEYAHAVKLYYRKFRAYPPSIAALETTNNMRFLRHKFKDPMTGEDNWRLLHAGAGGQLIDSKVTPIGLTANGQNSSSSGLGSTNSSSSSTASAANTALGFPSTSGASPVDSANMPGSNGTVNAAGLPQRPPEMPTNGGAVASVANTANQDPTQSLLSAPQPSGIIMPAPIAGALTGGAGVTPEAAAPGNQGNPMQGVQQLINNPNPPTPAGAPATTGSATASSGAGSGGAGSTSTSTSSGMGVINTGGLAGVASLAKGRTIKAVNDQTDYSLWEFYYDPTKDTSAVGGQSGMGAAAGVPQINNPLNPNGNSSSTNSNSSTTPATPGTSPSTGLTPTPTPLPTSTQPQQPPFQD